MISATVLVKNGSRTLKAVLEALKAFPEVILADTGSTDQTLEIAKQFSNVKIFHVVFDGFGKTRNEIAKLASHDWILAIDCDEVLSLELQQELEALPLDCQSIYSLPFRNFYNGKHIRFAGWHPESHIRLYNRTKTSFAETKVHEGVLVNDLKVKKLRSPVDHYPYDTISDFLVKMERYSTLFAEEHRHKKRATPQSAFIHGFAAFVKSFFFKKGFLGGYEGFLISVYNAHTAYYKYLKLYHANNNACNSDVPQNRKRETH